MANTYRKPGDTLFISKLMFDIRKLKDELNQHRYGLERSVKRETAQLLKRIALLESCNASLSGRLAQAQKEIGALKQQQSIPLVQDMNATPTGRAVRLYVMNNPSPQAACSMTQEKWDGHATAA